MPTFNSILDFWFAGLTDAQIIDRESSPAKKWFTKDAKFDEEIRSQFQDDYIKALQGEFKEWEDSPRGRLALVILYDQFSRNMFRNTPFAYEADPLALFLTLRSIKDGMDIQLQLIEQLFLYMPLMHSEEIKGQELSVKVFEKLAKESKEKSPQNVFYYEYTLDYAKRHYAIIAKFGRFPHRNALLGRRSSAEEFAFLRKPGSSF